MINCGEPVYPAERQCIECGTVYRGSLVRFAFSTEHPQARTAVGTQRDASQPSVLKSVCTPCLQERQQERAKRDPLGAKAASVIRTHASRLKKSTWAIRHEYSWQPDRVVAEFSDKWERGKCPGCKKPFREMRGYQDMTVDIIDRSKPPYWGVNTQILCDICNREKGARSPEEWGGKLAVWEERERQMKERPRERGRMTLWDWLTRQGKADAEGD